jgi:uncharacterized protein YdhG (YjbR/CyaY superfamily)
MTMQYDAQTPKEYLEMLEDDWRKERLLEVRQLILDLAPELTETVRYKMLTYEAGEQFIFGLNAQKGYVSLYIGAICLPQVAWPMISAKRRDHRRTWLWSLRFTPILKT